MPLIVGLRAFLRRNNILSEPLLVFFLPTTRTTASTELENIKLISMDKILNINKINYDFHSRRFAYARVVGRKNTNNGWLRLLPKSKINNGKNDNDFGIFKDLNSVLMHFIILLNVRIKWN